MLKQSCSLALCLSLMIPLSPQQANAGMLKSLACTAVLVTVMSGALAPSGDSLYEPVPNRLWNQTDINMNREIIVFLGQIHKDYKVVKGPFVEKVGDIISVAVGEVYVAGKKMNLVNYQGVQYKNGVSSLRIWLSQSTERAEAFNQSLSEVSAEGALELLSQFPEFAGEKIGQSIESFAAFGGSLYVLAKSDTAADLRAAQDFTYASIARGVEGTFGLLFVTSVVGGVASRVRKITKSVSDLLKRSLWKSKPEATQTVVINTSTERPAAVDKYPTVIYPRNPLTPDKNVPYTSYREGKSAGLND